MYVVCLKIRLLIACLLISMLLALTACSLSMSKEEREKNILHTPSIQASISQALDTTSFISSKWPEKSWWKSYGLEELNALIELALTQNPSIQAIKQRIEFAKSQSTIARSKLLPLIYFNASDQWTYLSQNGLYRALNPNIGLNTTLVDFSLSFSYEFDFWSKYRNLYKAALGREQAAIAETAQVELITSVALAQTYFALKTNLIRKQLYEELLRLKQEYFNLQTLLLKNSLTSELEPLLSEETVFEAQQFVYTIEQEIAVDTHLINILSGRNPDELLSLNEPLPLLVEPLALPTDISIELLARRPDLMAQIWQVDAYAHEVGSAKAEFWPDISLTALAGLQTTSWAKLFEWASKTIGAVPGLKLPLYTAGAIGANVSAKKALFNEAVYQYNDLILKSFQQVTDLLAIGKSVYGKKEQQMQIVANASTRYELTLLRKNQGIDNAFIGYLFLEELLEKQLIDVELLYQQYLVSVTLIKALGGGYIYNEGLSYEAS